VPQVVRSRIDSQPPAASSGQGDGAAPSLADLEARENVWLSTGDLARVCGTTVRTVRFYEESGLLAPLTRSDGGHRLYRGDAPERLQLVMDLREAGLSLQEVRDLFDLKSSASEPKAAAEEMRAALHEKIATVNEKIAVLRRLRDELGAMVGVLDECARCTRSGFPRACAGCDVMKAEDLPRAMRLLWRGPSH
jgi:MerR family Zn(II)-responsive transcriptional regulator of zntA